MFISLFKFLIDPFNIFWILLFAVFGTWLLKKEHLFKWLSISVIGWFLIISTPLLPNALLNSLEDCYEPVYIEKLSSRETEYHIIILGGGHGFDDRLPANSLLSGNALGRLSEGIRLHRQLPNSKLVLSGSSSTPGRTTQAGMLQKAALLLGVDSDDTILQKEPRNTYEEAEVYSKNYGNCPVILVTSAVHMPRAMKAFSHFGIEAIASPTNYRLKGSWKRKWLGLPALDNIENLRVVIKEYAGILWYSL